MNYTLNLSQQLFIVSDNSHSGQMTIVIFKSVLKF